MSRTATVERKTNETDISISIELDGSGQCEIATGIPFLDHMLHHVGVHGCFDLNIKVVGDLEIDAHHTVEDCALVLGSAFDQALEKRIGIQRMGSASVPMDESLADVVVDLSGRPFCRIEVNWLSESLGAMNTRLVNHFFRSFATNARCNLHGTVRFGEDDHHQAEALFKAFGRALDKACQIDPRRLQSVPSTKGVI